jgi:aspartate/methionine/tyrosine aminotransferase
MIDTGAYGTSMRVAEAMLEAGVVTVPGAAFGKECENYLRVSFCADKSTLTEGVSRMKKALQQMSEKQMSDAGC